MTQRQKRKTTRNQAGSPEVHGSAFVWKALAGTPGRVLVKRGCQEAKEGRPGSQPLL